MCQIKTIYHIISCCDDFTLSINSIYSAGRDDSCENGRQFMRILRIALAVLAAGTLAAACGVTTPSDLKTEPLFIGTIHPGDTVGSGAALPTMTFTSGSTGEFIVKVISVTPDSGATIGILYGAPSAGLCGLEGNVLAAQQGHTAFDQQLPQGDYCLQVYDSGLSFTVPETFTISVQHS